MSKKTQKFRLEIGLGLALIILVLLILNFGAQYTIYRVESSLKKQIEDELYEAAMVVANEIKHLEKELLPDSTIDKIKKEYALSNLSVIHLDQERLKDIKKSLRDDSMVIAIDSMFDAESLPYYLLNKTQFHHQSGENRSFVIFSTENKGSKYIIVVGHDSPLLGSIETAGRILIFFGLLGLCIILYVAFRFARYVVYPFEQLKKEAEKTGRLQGSDDDEVRQLLGTYENIINELRQKEKELVALNEIISRDAADLEIYNNYILESISIGVITLDKRRKISTVNHAAAEFFNINAVDVSGIELSQLFGEYPQFIGVLEQFFDAGMSKSERQVEISDSQGGGDKKILAVYLSPLSDSRGDIIGGAVLINDRTEFSRLQQELELKRRMAALGEMSGGLAHQLRNSLGAIVGFARLTKKKVEPGTVVDQNIGNLLRESAEAGQLMSRFLDFARPLDVDHVQFEIDKLVTQITDNFKEQYHNVEITCDCNGESSIMLSGDPLLLKQALSNIIDNGCKALDGASGRLRINMKSARKSVEIEITDNGCGIPDEYKEKIFTPFFSGSPSGSGLGLSLARKIISLHQGHLEFRTVEGEGTTFRITLPIHVADRGIDILSRKEKTSA